MSEFHTKPAAELVVKIEQRPHFSSEPRHYFLSSFARVSLTLPDFLGFLVTRSHFLTGTETLELHFIISEDTLHMAHSTRERLYLHLYTLTSSCL